MIKVNATINGTISKAAMVRTNKDGKAFTTFGVAVVIPASNGMQGSCKRVESQAQLELSRVQPNLGVANKTIEVSAIKDGQENTAAYVVGQRIELTGELTFRKKEENMYFNFAVASVNHTSAINEDCIKGELLMRGSCGKTIEQKTTKNGKQMLVFSAYSATKEARSLASPNLGGTRQSESELSLPSLAQAFTFTWVRFVGFDHTQPDWLQPKATLEAKGELELSVYNDRVNLGCKLTELKPWDKPAYTPRDTAMKPLDETEAMPF